MSSHLKFHNLRLSIAFATGLTLLLIFLLATAAKYHDKDLSRFSKNIRRNQCISLFTHLETMTIAAISVSVSRVITADGSMNKTQS